MLNHLSSAIRDTHSGRAVKAKSIMARLNPTTTEVAALRRLGRHVDARWVDWAIDMLDASAQSDSICSLAAATTPFNAFEMADLVDSALRE
jgi:hypothetical protein